MDEQGDRSGVDSSDSFTMVAKSWKFLMVYWLSQEEEGDEAVARRRQRGCQIARPWNSGR
jgi:hypothetical protein